MRIQALLYHGFDATASIEISTTSIAGPWTKLTLTAKRYVTDALAEWTTLANAALPTRTWNFYQYVDGTAQTRIALYGSGGASWVRLSRTMADLLGFSALTFALVAQSDQWPMAIIEDDPAATRGVFAYSFELPMEREEADLTEYRAARASVYHFGRGRDIEVDLFFAPAIWAAIKSSPLVSGHMAFQLYHANATAFDTQFQANQTATGAIGPIYPYDTPFIEQESPDDHARVTLRCTLEDP